MQINPKMILEMGIIENLGKGQVQQVGIDLTLKELLLLEHGMALNVDLEQIIKLPHNIFSLFYGRSSYNRKGVLIRGSVYDPGYNGGCGCTIYNMSGQTLVINPGERVGQMVFFKADPASGYEGQYQNEKL